MDSETELIKSALAEVEWSAWSSAEWPQLYDDETWDVFCVSDIHTDFPANMKWWKSLKKPQAHKSCLVLAGDIGHSMSVISETLKHATETFDEVFFVPGNHELYYFGSEGKYEPEAYAELTRLNPGTKTQHSSLAKFLAVIKLCQDLRVRTTPALLSRSLAILPLFTWYDSDFGSGSLTPQELNFDRGCRFPAFMGKTYDGHVASFFASLNDRRIRTAPTKVTTVSFSHFLPRTECFVPLHLKHVMGSHHIDTMLRKAHSNIHVCGHSHVSFDFFHDGVRYVQAPKGYPAEFFLSRLPFPQLLLRSRPPSGPGARGSDSLVVADDDDEDNDDEDANE